MAEPTLQDTFGAGATQTANSWTISKADFPTLTATANNSAEQLLVALMLKLRDALTTTRQANNPEQSITVEEFGTQLVPRNDQQYYQLTLAVNLQQVQPAIQIDPDNF